jgi:hypothetical protein
MRSLKLYYLNPPVLPVPPVTPILRSVDSDLIEENGLKIFPNPSSDRITIDYNEKINKISFFNLIGKLVYEKQSNVNTEVIDVSSLLNGMYLVRVETNNAIIQNRFMK